MAADSVALGPGDYIVIQDKTGMRGVVRYWVHADAPFTLYVLDQEGLNEFVAGQGEMTVLWEEHGQKHAENQLRTKRMMDWWLLVINDSTHEARVSYATGPDAWERMT